MRLGFLILAILICSLQLHGQNEEIRISQLPDSVINISGASKLHLVTDRQTAENLAKSDIDNGYPFLNLISGEAPTFYPEQIDFEREFKAYYIEHGCLSPPVEIVEAYNFIVLDYLDKKYGKNCISKVRKDVFGFKKWKNRK